MDIFDVIIVGGGPSGMLAAISAKQHGSEVLLIEKNNRLGKKMQISGGGRCNLSNKGDINQLVANIPGNGRFLYSAFDQFSNDDLIHFVEKELKIKTKVEDLGRVFPLSDRSVTIIEALKLHLENIGVQILYHTIVEEIKIDQGKISGVRLNNNRFVQTHAVILATGGVSYPKTGSTGDGFKLAKSVGHTVTDLFPTSVPILSDEPIIKEKRLQGVSLKNVTISLYGEKNKPIKTEEGDLLFTHFGLSGPVALRISRYVALAQRKGSSHLKLVVDITPNKNKSMMYNEIISLIKENPKKFTSNGFIGLIPEKLLRVILEEGNISTKKMSELSNKDIENLIESIKSLSLNIKGTMSLNEAFVTGGGVNLKEIDPKTLSSKLVQGLYFVGEVLDIDGYTGGYNLQVAFSTGYVAGKSASNFGLALKRL